MIFQSKFRIFTMRILNVNIWNISVKYSCHHLKRSCLVLHKIEKSSYVIQQVFNSKHFSCISKDNANLNNSSVQRNIFLINSQNKCIENRRYFSLNWLDNLAITQAKWFQSLSESVAVDKSITFLKYIHDSLHVPWWLSIIISTVLLRTMITFPLAIYQVSHFDLLNY